MKLMEINLNNVGVQIKGIAWRIENKIVDKLRKIHREYDSDDEVLNQIEKDLACEAEKLDFIGEIFANSTDKDGE